MRKIAFAFYHFLISVLLLKEAISTQVDELERGQFQQRDVQKTEFNSLGDGKLGFLSVTLGTRFI